MSQADEQQQQQSDQNGNAAAVQQKRRDSVDLNGDSKSQEVSKDNKVANGSPKNKKIAVNGSNAYLRTNKTQNASVLGSLSKKSQNNILVLTNAAVSGKQGRMGVVGAAGRVSQSNSRNGSANSSPTHRKGSRKHRRAGTLTTNTPFGKRGSPASQQLLQDLSNNLSRDEANDMNSSNSIFLLEKELENARIEISEHKSERDRHLDIIKQLEEEVENLNIAKETLAQELFESRLTVQKLEITNETLRNAYEQEKASYEQFAQEKEEDVQQLEEQLREQKDQLVQAKQIHDDMREENEKLHKRMTSIASDIESSAAVGISTTKERSLYEKYQNEKRKVFEEKQRNEALMAKLEKYLQLEIENEKLQDKLNEAEDQILQEKMNKDENIAAMSAEIMALASRNSQLESEKNELLETINARDYEAHQLRGYIEKGRMGTARGDGPKLNWQGSNAIDANRSSAMLDANSTNLGNDLENAEDVYYDYEDEVEDDVSMEEEEVEDDSEDNGFQAAYEIIDQKPMEESKKEEKPLRPVADVTKEYLHLTASIMKIKYPQVNTISSEDLIKQVQNFAFWEYHDHMVRLMKLEIAKIEEKKKTRIS